MKLSTRRKPQEIFDLNTPQTPVDLMLLRRAKSPYKRPKNRLAFDYQSANKGRYLTVDSKSTVPKQKQIQQQIQEITKGCRLNTADFISTDDFRELKQIEKQFGAIDLGFKRSFDELNYWGTISSAMLKASTSKSKFRKFIDMISKSQRQACTYEERMKKVALQEYLEERLKERSQSEIDAIRQLQHDGKLTET